MKRKKYILSTFERLRATSETIKKKSTIISLEITMCKIQKPHPTPRREKSRQERTVSADSWATRPKVCRNRAPNENLPTQKSGKIPALHTSQRNQSTDLDRKSTDWFP